MTIKHNNGCSAPRLSRYRDTLETKFKVVGKLATSLVISDPASIKIGCVPKLQPLTESRKLRSNLALEELLLAVHPNSISHSIPAANDPTDQRKTPLPGRFPSLL
jgi:hypothetical protein